MIRRYQQKLWNALKKAELLEVDFYQKNGTPRYKFHMHSFRHVCGTNLRRAGMKIEDIRDFLGHEDIETAQVYTELTRDDQLHNIFDEFIFCRIFFPFSVNIYNLPKWFSGLRHFAIFLFCNSLKQSLTLLNFIFE